MIRYRDRNEMLADWTEELSVLLGRSQTEILSRGLSAYDFSADSSVEIRTSGGATFRFPSAFSLIRQGKGVVAVFSEHDGYLEFQLMEGDVVTQFHESRYTHQ